MANVGDGLVRGQLIEVELDARVVAVVAGQWITKKAIHHHGRSRHTHDATFQGTQAGHAAFCGAHCAQNLLRVGIEISSPLPARAAAMKLRSSYRAQKTRSCLRVMFMRVVQASPTASCCCTLFRACDGAKLRMEPGVREKRTGTLVATSVPSVGCSTRLKKPVAARWGSSRSSGMPSIRECGISASPNRSSQACVVRCVTTLARSA